MLFQIVIVDDESYIANSTALLLRTTFEEELDIHVFTDPLKALEHIRRSKVNVLVTDIRMPSMDGLTLLKNTRSIWPKCEGVFLTAYSEFQYAYDALKSPFVAYVLKADGIDAIREAVGKAIARLKSEYSRSDLLISARRDAENAHLLLQKNAVRELLTAAKPLPETLLPLTVDVEKPFHMVLVRSDTAVFDARAVSECVELSLPEEAHFFQTEVDASLFVWWIQYAFRDRQQIAAVLENAQDALITEMRLSCSLTYSANAAALSETPDLYRALCLTDAARHAKGEEMWLCDISDKEKENLADAENAFAALCAYDGVDSLAFMRLYSEMAQPLIEKLDGMTERELRDMNAQYLFNPSLHTSPLAAAQYLSEAQNTLAEDGSAAGDTLAQDITRYIEEHLSEDVSLIALAGHVHMNASYLSRVFKRKTGKSLSETINAIRAERACKMLAEGAKVNDVAKATGFSTGAYFAFFFKKIMGMTPGEYRTNAGKQKW